MAVVYCFENKINGKKYVGYAIDLKGRIGRHLYSSRKNPQSYFHKALKKYGFENFKVKILEESDNVNYIYQEREPYWIKELNTFYPNGYNLTLGGKGSLGMGGKLHPNYGKPSPRKKIKKKTSRVDNPSSYKTDENRNKKHGWYGKKLSHNHRKKCSESRKELWKNKSYRESVEKAKSKYIYEITHPCGKKEIITNLSKFCKENNLSQGTMRMAVIGKRLHHNFFKGRIIGNLNEVD
jgi:group I intron endonuclease